MRFIELFAGIGGFRYGLERASKQFKCAWANDIDGYVCQVYREHFGAGELQEGNITTIGTNAIPNHDLICAGFPCQSFSLAGKRGGFEDTRGTLFFEICRIARDKRTPYLLLENVKGLLSHDEGDTFQTILRALDELGYDAQWQVLECNHWIPQSRERIFIVSTLRTKPWHQIFPILEDPTWDTQMDEKVPNAPTLTASYSADGYGAGRPYVIHGELVEREGKLSPMRALTPEEFEQIQGFPRGWTQGIKEKERYKSVGNAVPPDVIESIGKKLLEGIDGQG